MDVLETPVGLLPPSSITESWNINIDAALGADTNGSLTFTSNGSGGNTRMVINDYTGNLGIGTLDPKQKLHIYDPSNPSVYALLEARDSNAYWIANTGGDNGGGLIIQSQGTAKAFVYWTNNSPSRFAIDVNGGDRLTILNNGNVGIGGLNPQAKLDVSGTFRVNEGTIFSRIQAGTATIGSSNLQRKNLAITFPTPFLDLPKVIVTARAEDLQNVFAVTTGGISNEQFLITILRLDSPAGWSQNLQLDWMAWQ